MTGEAEPMMADGFDPDRDNAIGGALLDTEHIGGTARRAPYFVKALETVGWTVVPLAARTETIAELRAAVEGLPRDRGDEKWDTVVRGEVLALLASRKGRE